MPGASSDVGGAPGALHLHVGVKTAFLKLSMPYQAGTHRRERRVQLHRGLAQACNYCCQPGNTPPPSSGAQLGMPQSTMSGSNSRHTGGQSQNCHTQKSSTWGCGHVIP